jgi:guanylate kinase
MPKLKNKIVCIVGESGSGKTTLYDLLRAQGHKVVESYTTRPPRYPNELGHTFVTQEEFHAIRGDLAAYTEFDGHEYGTTFSQLQNSEFYIIDPAGVEYFSEKIGRKNFTVVYIRCSEMACFIRMRKDRGEKEAFIRINHDAEKFKDFFDFDEIRQNEYPGQIKENIEFLVRLYKESNGLEA